MKNKLTIRTLSLCVLTLFASMPAAWAQNVIKANTTSMATNATSNSGNWLSADPGNGGVAQDPLPSYTGEFDATVSASSLANMTLGGAALVVAGLQFDANMNGPLVLGAGNTLAVGASGINMSSANTNVTINAGYWSGASQTWTVAPNTTLNLNGAVTLDEPSSGTAEPFFHISGTQVITITGGGTVNVPNATLIPNFTGSTTGIANGSGVVINNVTFNGQGITIERNANIATAMPSLTGPIALTTTSGFIVNGASSVVNLGTLTIGGAFGNNPAAGNIINGATTVSGAVTIGATPSNSNPARWGGFEVSGGSFTALDTVNGFQIATSPSGILNPMEVYFAGGVSTIGKILIGSPLDPATATNETAIYIDGGTLYLGSGGLAAGNSSTNNVPFNSANGQKGYQISLFAGILGAYTNWSSSLNMILSSTTGTPFDIQTADANSVPHNITLSGVISDGGSSAPLTITGGGILTLANTNTYTGITAINGGTVNLGAPETAGVSGPLGEPTTVVGSILFGGGTLQYSAANQYDYSGRFDNGTLGSQPISIDTAGQNVTFASALQGAGTSLTKIGNGTLTLAGANTYDTGTTISGGILSVNNTTGSGTGSGLVTVGSGSELGGSGTIAGNVAVNSGGETLPGASSPGHTLTIGGNLTYNNGSSAVFDLSASASGAGNDKIVLNGGSSTLTCGGTLTINVTGAALDTNDYVLYSVPSGTISGAFLTVPILTGTPLFNPQDYSVQKVGSQVILHYTSINPPVISGQTALPSPVQANQNVTFSATVTPGDYSISNVTVNLSALGGSATQPLALQSGHLWNVTVTVPASAFPGIYGLGITAADISNNTTTVSVQLTVAGAAGATETWNGGVFGTSPNWSQNGNWTSVLAPGFGDNIFFANSIGLTPVMNQSYSLAGVTFNSGAGSFTITNGNNGVLTLTGGATNNSSVRQTLNVPVAVNAANVTVNDVNSAGLVINGVVSGPSSDSLTTAGNVTLNNANGFAGTTLVSSGTLTLSNALALQSSTLNNNGSGTLSFGSLTTASLGALAGSKNLSLENATPAPVALVVGGNNTSQTYSGNLTDTGNGASLTLAGTGSLTLSGANAYSGGTTNPVGSILILGGSTGPLGGGSYAGPILNNGTLAYQSSAAQILSGTISGTGPLNDTGLGTLTLSGASSYNGVITIGTGSKLTLDGNGLLGGGNYLQNITDNGTLTFSNNATQTLSGTISGSGALTENGTSTLILNNANPAFTGPTTVSTAGATLQINNSSALKSSVLNLNAGKVTFGNGVTLVNLAGLGGSTNLALVDAGNPVILSISSGTAQTFSGNLTDGGLASSLSIGGAGQILKGTNTFTGNIGIAAGTLTISGAGELGGGNYPGYISPQVNCTFTWASSASQTLSGALGSAGFEGAGNVNVTGTGPLTLATSSALSGAGTLTIGSGAVFNITGGGQLEGANYAGADAQAMSISGTFNYSSSNTTTLSGAIAGSGGKINVNASFNSDNGAFCELSLTSGSSTYTNSVTTVTSGILNYSSDRSAGAVPGSVITNIFLNGGDLMGSGTFTLNTNRDIGVGPATGAVGTNALIDSLSATFTIGGAIVSAGNTGVIGLVINSESGSSGTVALAGTNTFTGNITIDAGELSISDPGSLGLGIYAGNITNNGTFDYSGSGSQTLSGVISDGLISLGGLSVGGFPPASGAPTGILALTGANTFTGQIQINAGTLNFNGGGLLGAVTANSGSYAGNISDYGTLNFTGNGSQVLSGSKVGSGGISHSGTGNLTLSGYNTYSGPTTNNNGTLTLVGDGRNTGFLFNTAVVAVNSPGIVDPSGLTSDGSLHIGDLNLGQPQQVFTGNGIVISNVVVGYNGTLDPGPATGYGTLTISNNLTVGDVSNGKGAIIMNVDHLLTGAAYDSVTAKSISILVNGGAPPTLTVNQGNNDLQTGDTFHLFNITGNSGVSTLSKLVVTLPTTSPDSMYTYVWNTNSLAVNGTLILTIGAPAVSPINTNAATANFTAVQLNGSLKFSWAPDHLGWQLYTNSVGVTAANSWFPVSGSSAVTNETITINPANPKVFFQLRYP